MSETIQTENLLPTKYQTHLKRILHDYKKSSKSGLYGPAGYEDSIKNKIIMTEDKPRSPSPPPVMHTTSDDIILKKNIVMEHPFYYPPDCSRSGKKETVLEGELISCFNIGGEKRLCMPHVIQFVLKDFGIEEIVSAVQKLSINLAKCSIDQLELLKSSGRDELRLPEETAQCGLITRTDAERLCATLLPSSLDSLEQATQHIAHSSNDSKSFTVYHECFGKVLGTFSPSLYLSPDAPCIYCLKCETSYSPAQFVRHSHLAEDTCSVCHWGFDSSMWRHYLLLAKHQQCKDEAQITLKCMKTRFRNGIDVSISVKRELLQRLYLNKLVTSRNRYHHRHLSEDELDDTHCSNDVDVKRRRRKSTLIPFSSLITHPANQPSSFTAYQPWNNSKQHFSKKHIANRCIEESPLLEPKKSHRNQESRDERNYTPNVTLARSNNLLTPIAKKAFISSSSVNDCTIKHCEDINSSSGASSMSSSECSDMLRSKDDKIPELFVSVPAKKRLLISPTLHNNNNINNNNNNNNDNNKNNNNSSTNHDSEKVQALQIANASLQKQLEMAIQKSNETEIESNEIIRQHIIENQQLRTDFHHSLIAIDARWRNLLGEQNIVQYMEQQFRKSQNTVENIVKSK